MKIRFTWTRSLAVVSAVSLVLPLADSARAQQSPFDWKQASGTKLVVMLNKHPYADDIIKRLQEFKVLTGIDVETSETPEENYFDKLTHKLPLEQYEEGLEMMKKGDKSLKILLVP